MIGAVTRAGPPHDDDGVSQRRRQRCRLADSVAVLSKAGELADPDVGRLIVRLGAPVSWGHFAPMDEIAHEPVRHGPVAVAPERVSRA